MKHLIKLQKQIVKKSAVSLALSLLVVSLVSCKPPYAFPKAEICVHYDDGGAGCTDLRLPEDERTYDNYKIENYICTNPKDYQTMMDYVYDIREKLITCEANLRKRK